VSDRRRPRAVRRVGEPIEAFNERARWGRFDEFAIAFAADLDRKYAPGTAGQYRSDINVMLLPTLGDMWLTECDAHSLDLVLSELDGRTLRQEAAIRTLGSMATWAVNERRWPTDTPAFGGPEYRRARRRNLRAAAPAKRNEKIHVRHCPTIDDAVELAGALELEARNRYTIDRHTARQIGQVPVVQLLTGTRIAETFALQKASFSADLSTVHVHAQFHRRGTQLGNQPPVAPPKYGTMRTAVVWEWAAELLEETVDSAEQHLFPRASGRGRWIDTWEKLCRKVRVDLGYRWALHYHRHAYVTTNLAPAEDGGYGRSIPDVATWVGDLPSTIVDTYWHPGQAHPSGWSRWRPGRPTGRDDGSGRPGGPTP